MHKVSLLLVEDDETLGYVLSEYLKMKNYDVHWAKNGVQGLEMFMKFPVDLCIVDIMMPEKDGFELAENIKAVAGNIPIMFLTARSMKVDKLKGFKLGADDYVTKPVDEEELLARIEAILKRTRFIGENREEEEYRFGKYVFYPSQRLLVIDEQKIQITEKESLLLDQLLRYKNTLMPRVKALKLIWGANDYFNRKSMDVHIYRLRKLLKYDKDVSIINIHGKGYILKDKK